VLAAPPVVQVHTMQPGESLAEVAARYGVSVETLRAANDLDDPDRVPVGQPIRVPSSDGVLHLVQPGESLHSIAERYGIDTSAVVAANGLTDPDVLEVGSEILLPAASAARPVAAEPDRRAPESAAAAPRVASGRTYVVQRGDTLRSIAEAAGVDILSLIAANQLDDPEMIAPGRELRIVGTRPREHVVQPGETLAGIAEQYDLDVSALLGANAISDPDVVAIGTALVIPDASGTAVAAPAPVLVQASRPAAAPPTPTPVPPTPVPARPTPTPVPAAPAAQAGGRVISARVTGYAAGAGASGTRTASGTTTHWGTVAADTRQYPFGTRVQIEGFGDMVFVVEDTGSAVRGNVFDVWFADAADARALGSRTRRVTIISPAG
jgi:LysM repeat protein